MSLFKKTKEITKEQGEKLNSFLPKELRKDLWENKYIKKYDSNNFTLYDTVRNFLINKKTELTKAKESIDKIIEENKIEASSKIKLYNTELFNAKPIALVDVGIVKTFTTASSGDRYRTIVGSQLERAFDEVWAQNNAQISSVKEAQMQLKLKAHSIYPECTSIFKFEIDFRELGTSGNVFLYARGTACVGEENKEITEAIKEGEKKIQSKNSEIEHIEKEIEFVEKNIQNIPSTIKEIEAKLN